MTLKSQPTYAPTRKVWAAIVAGMVVGALQSALSMFAPDLDATQLLQQVDIWVQTGAMVLASYFTRDRA